MLTGVPPGIIAPERVVKPGLARTRALLNRLGNPERSFPAIHVAGTNGKGSVVAFLESVLAAAGVRVGAYTSPDLGDPTERIRVAGRPITAERLSELIRQAVLPAEELRDGAGLPTYFEVLTAAAFAHFAREGVELGVVEAGLGGRFDATNTLPHKLLTLVTSVEQEHIDFFGPGLYRAAWEKAGITTAGVPFLTGEQKDEVIGVFAQVCRDEGAALVFIDPGDVRPVELSWERAVWRSRDDPFDLGPFETGLIGLYQGENLALVLGALGELSGGVDLSPEAVREGLAQARWPGRFEVFSQRPYIVLDGAHNPAGALALAATLDALPLPAGHRTLMFGALREKMVRLMAETLFPRFDEVVLVESRSERALPVAALSHQARRCARAWRIGGPVGETVRNTVGTLAEDALLVISGSLSVVGEARRALSAALG